MIPAAIAVMATAVVVRSDTVPVQTRVEKPMGTIYWGGAGLDGDYLRPQLIAFKSIGVQHLWMGLSNTGSQIVSGFPGTMIDAVRSGLLIRYESNADWVISSGMNVRADQFNLLR